MKNLELFHDVLVCPFLPSLLHALLEGQLGHDDAEHIGVLNFNGRYVHLRADRCLACLLSCLSHGPGSLVHRPSRLLHPAIFWDEFFLLSAEAHLLRDCTPGIFQFIGLFGVRLFVKRDLHVAFRPR